MKNSSLLATGAVFLASLRDAFLAFPAMIRKRGYIQGRKKVSDEEIKRWFRELGMGFFESVYK